MFRLTIEFEPETGNVSLNGPLENYGVCDVMLEGAKRILLKRWLDAQKSNGKIAVVHPIINPMKGT